MRKFKVERLTRDNKISFFKQRGMYIDYTVLSEEDYIKALKDKIVEEATEIVNTTNKQEIVCEMVDVLEAMFYLKKVCKITEEEVRDKLIAKHEKFGGFEKRIMSHFVEIEEDNKKDLEYFLANPDKFPEIK